LVKDILTISNLAWLLILGGRARERERESERERERSRREGLILRTAEELFNSHYFTTAVTVIAFFEHSVFFDIVHSFFFVSCCGA